MRTPDSVRLSAAFSRELATAARRTGADWAVVLGVLRAEGRTGSTPASAARLTELAGELAGARSLVPGLPLTNGDETAERAVALAGFYRAVGLRALVEGLAASRTLLAARVLADERVDLYEGGRADVGLGRVDVRILALVAYLAETYGQVTVSSLVSGHRMYARPGVLSAHVFGEAVDIAAVGGMPILGNSQPGGLTEHAVRSILLLPEDLLPKQVISLLALGGPSFPLEDHADHIHVGY